MAYKFCPECGGELEPAAQFCGSCGNSVRRSNAPSGPLPLAGLVSLVALLILGGGFWLYSRTVPEPQRPLKPGERAPGVAANAPRNAPQGSGAPHPPVELPEDIKAYMAGLQKEADENPDDKEKWTTLAGVYFRASRLDKNYLDDAQAAFQHLIDRDENDLEGLRGLGNLAYDRQDRAEAISYYERYLALSPESSEVRTDLGTMYYENDQAERAITAYQTVLATDPDFYQAHFNLAVVYDASGDRAAAHAALERARDTASEDPVKQRLEALLQTARSDNLSLADAAAKLASSAAATAPPGAPAAPPAAAAAASAPAPADTFQGAVEQLFRGHRIAGPKVVDVEWTAPDRARVLLANFPMDQMPEVMKIGYLGKMATGVKEAQTRFAVDGAVVVELVDQPTGTVMATVDPSQAPES